LRRTTAAIMLSVLALAGLAIGTVYIQQAHMDIKGWLLRKLTGGRSVDERLERFGSAAEKRLRPYLHAADLPFPPDEIALVGIKRDKLLQLYGRRRQGPWRFVRDYPILGASGVEGPKLREGDRQVPEGIYRIIALNPNSLYHVSLRLDYPNAFDRAMGGRDGRTDLGSDIMIHGKTASVGCLAMGDPVAEELFTLVARLRPAAPRVILVPKDFRDHPVPILRADSPSWTAELYRELRTRLAEFPPPP